MLAEDALGSITHKALLRAAGRAACARSSKSSLLDLQFELPSRMMSQVRGNQAGGRAVVPADPRAIRRRPTAA